MLKSAKLWKKKTSTSLNILLYLKANSTDKGICTSGMNWTGTCLGSNKVGFECQKKFAIRRFD